MTRQALEDATTMRQHTRLATAILVALIFAGGCRAMDDTAAPSAVTDTRWRVEDIDGARADAASSTLQFQGADKISGSTGCNRYSAPVTLTGDGLQIGPVIATRKACPPPLMQQEQRFTAALAAAHRYTVDERYLLIFDASGKERLRLGRDTAPE